LPVISYGFEAWCLVLREGHRIRVFANWLHRETCESRMDDVTRDWRKLHNDELHYQYSSPNITLESKLSGMILVGHMAPMGEKRGSYWVLVGKLEGKRSLGRPRPKWEDNIKTGLQTVSWEDVD